MLKGTWKLLREEGGRSAKGMVQAKVLRWMGDNHSRKGAEMEAVMTGWFAFRPVPY